MDFTAPDNWPLWLAAVVVFVKMFQTELAAFLPTAVRERLASRAALRRDRQEHAQELEEASTEALMQSSVTAQMQLIQVNQTLVNYLTGQLDERLGDLEQLLREVRDAVRDETAQSQIVQIEWSRVVEALGRTELLLGRVEVLMSRRLEGSEYDD